GAGGAGGGSAGGAARGGGGARGGGSLAGGGGGGRAPRGRGGPPATTRSADVSRAARSSARLRGAEPPRASPPPRTKHHVGGVGREPTKAPLRKSRRSAIIEVPSVGGQLSRFGRVECTCRATRRRAKHHAKSTRGVWRAIPIIPRT